MARRDTLLDSLSGLIERTYAFHSGIRDPGAFVVGDEGYRRLLAGRHVVLSADAAACRARVLLRPVGERWAVALYYPDALIERLERNDPRRGLGDRNVDDFATFVEELDHLLTLADRARPDRPPLTLLELEWHGEVTKYLCTAHFLARGLGLRDLTPSDRVWLRFHLFEKTDFVEPDPRVNERYRRARRQAVRFLDGMVQLSPADRVAMLRRFHRASHQEKLREWAA
jgi:hypothetical protein